MKCGNKCRNREDSYSEYIEYATYAMNADRSPSGDSGVGTVPSANSPSRLIEAMDARSVDILQKERELAEREIQLLKREVEMMREMQRLSVGGQSASAMVNESMRAMLSYFDGSGEAFDTWERQLALLRATYRLDDNAAKLLAVSRLKNQALEWFHSKPEHISMCIDDLMQELKDIFGDRQDRITARREFESRTWKIEETFAEYFHRKVILANRIRIDEEELIEYLIDGIPDHSLQNHAKLQKFKSQASLLEAFRGVSLQPTPGKGTRFGVDENWRRNTVWQREETRMQRSDGTEQHGSVAVWRAPPQRWEEIQRRDDAPRWRNEEIQRHNESRQREARDATSRRCYNCGERDHFFYDCPLRNRGAKCFECREFGHVAANCPKKRAPAMEVGLAVRQTPREEYPKRTTDESIKAATVNMVKLEREDSLKDQKIDEVVAEESPEEKFDVTTVEKERRKRSVDELGKDRVPEVSEKKAEKIEEKEEWKLAEKKEEVKPMEKKGEEKPAEKKEESKPVEKLAEPESPIQKEVTEEIKSAEIAETKEEKREENLKDMSMKARTAEHETITFRKQLDKMQEANILACEKTALARTKESLSDQTKRLRHGIRICEYSWRRVVRERDKNSDDLCSDIGRKTCNHAISEGRYPCKGGRM